jgi:hypothetical protein
MYIYYQMNKTKRRKQKTRTRRINKSRKNTVKHYNTLTSGGGDTAKLIILLEKLKKNIVNGQIDNVDQEFADVIANIKHDIEDYNKPNSLITNCSQASKKKLEEYKQKFADSKNGKINDDLQPQYFLKMLNYRIKTTDLVENLTKLIQKRLYYKCEKQYAPLIERLKRVPLWNLFNQEDNKLFEYLTFFTSLAVAIFNEVRINPSIAELKIAELNHADYLERVKKAEQSMERNPSELSESYASSPDSVSVTSS